MLASVRNFYLPIDIINLLITLQQNCISYSPATKIWTPKMPDFLLQPVKPLTITTQQIVPSIELLAADTDTAMADAPPLENTTVAQKTQYMEDVQPVQSPTDDSEDDSPEMKQLDVPKKSTAEPSSPSLTVPNIAFSVVKHAAKEMLQAGKTVRFTPHTMNIWSTNIARSWYATWSFFFETSTCLTILCFQSGTL
jgi:hypothetical protein